MITEFTTINQFGLVKLSGRLDTVDSKAVKDELPTYLDTAKYILIDCEDLVYLDSSGLGALLSVLKKALARGGDLRLANVHPKVKMTLDLTGADRLFQSYATIEKGISGWSLEHFK